LAGWPHQSTKSQNPIQSRYLWSNNSIRSSFYDTSQYYPWHCYLQSLRSGFPSLPWGRTRTPSAISGVGVDWFLGRSYSWESLGLDLLKPGTFTPGYGDNWYSNHVGIRILALIGGTEIQNIKGLSPSKSD